MDDAQLASALRTISTKWNCSTEVALSLLEAVFRERDVMGVNTNFGPWAVHIEEFRFEDDQSYRPDWTKALIPPNSKFERHIFADGRQIAKLITDNALILMAKELEPGSGKI